MMRISEGNHGKSFFKVKSISGMYVNKSESATYYQVEWEQSWENEHDLIGCEAIIRDFHKRQEKEMFGNAAKGNPAVDQLGDLKAALSEEIDNLRRTTQTKLNEIDQLMTKQKKFNEDIVKRLGTVDEEAASGYSSFTYVDRFKRPITNIPEPDVGNFDLDETPRAKDDENNELYFEDMFYNDYMEDNLEPRRKRGRGDIPCGIPVKVDINLVNRIKERLQAANCLHTESDVLHAVKVCSVRHILALKLTQIIFSNEELAAASFIPGNYKPLDDVKLSLIEDLSFMRFKVDDGESRDVSWSQINQRIKNKCRCKRKEYNDKLMGSLGSSYAGTSKEKLNVSANSKVSSLPFSSVPRQERPYPNSVFFNNQSFPRPTIKDVREQSRPCERRASPSFAGNTSANKSGSQVTTSVQASVSSSNGNGSDSVAVNTTSNNNSYDVTVVIKEDDVDYTD